MRTVLDTNVFVSILARPGRLTRVRQLWHEGRIQLLMDGTALSELQQVMKRPHLKLDPVDVDRALNRQVVPYAQLVHPFKGSLPYPCRDPDDDLFLRIALGGQADALVSGDKALLDLNGNYDFKIVKPREFLDRHFPEYLVSEPDATEAPAKNPRTRKLSRK